MKRNPTPPAPTTTWGAGIVVASGGLDSTVLMYWLASLGVASEAVFFDYGQRSASAQWRFVQLHAKEAGIPAQSVRMTMPTTRGGVYQRGFVPENPDDANGENALEGEELAEWRRKQWSWIEARNSVFMVWAAGLAAERNLGRVYVGFQEETREAGDNDELDVTAPFLEAVNALLTFGAVSRPVKVAAPFLDLGLNKSSIVKLGRKLEVDMDLTYSCEFHPPCNTCGACARRARAFGQTLASD